MYTITALNVKVSRGNMKKALLAIVLITMSAITAAKDNLFVAASLGGTTIEQISESSTSYDLELGYMLTPSFGLTVGITKLDSIDERGVSSDNSTRDTLKVYAKNIGIIAKSPITDSTGVSLGLGLSDVNSHHEFIVTSPVSGVIQKDTLSKCSDTATYGQIRLEHKTKNLTLTVGVKLSKGDNTELRSYSVGFISYF